MRLPPRFGYAWLLLLAAVLAAAFTFLNVAHNSVRVRTERVEVPTQIRSLAALEQALGPGQPVNPADVGVQAQRCVVWQQPVTVLACE